MPGTMGIEAGQIGRMNAGVGPSNSIKIRVTSSPGTSGIYRVMAGGTIFHIPAGAPAMLG